MMRTTCAMLLPRTFEPFAFLFCFFTFKSVFFIVWIMMKREMKEIYASVPLMSHGNVTEFAPSVHN